MDIELPEHLIAATAFGFQVDTKNVIKGQAAEFATVIDTAIDDFETAVAEFKADNTVTTAKMIGLQQRILSLLSFAENRRRLIDQVISTSEMAKGNLERWTAEGQQDVPTAEQFDALTTEMREIRASFLSSLQKVSERLDGIEA